jgi:hypothetical protein
MKAAACALLALLLLAATARAGIISRFPAGAWVFSRDWFFVSPDGYHYALIQVKDGVETLIKDGKVAAKGRPTFSTPDDSSRDLRVFAAFGNNGRLAMIQSVFDSKGQKVGEQAWSDGRAGKVYEQIQDLTLSLNGRRLAYAALDNGSWRLVMDGTEGPPLSGPPGSITFNPAGDQVAYLAGGSLFIGPKRIRPWDATQLLFSPDWKRVAWMKKEPTGTTVGIDDATLGRYYSLKATGFSPSGARFSYATLKEIDREYKGVVWIGGAQAGPLLKAMPKEIVFSPSDTAYWFGQLDSDEYVLFKEGMAGDRWKYITGTPAIAFSPSGAHSAYAATRPGERRMLVVDGISEPGGPNVMDGNAGIVFDNEREFHFLDMAAGLQLVCASVGPAPAPESSSCVQKARQIYPAVAADESQ